jgi:hypothetical protein
MQIVNYRDHKPQDNTYVYKFNPFTSDIAAVQNYLKGLTGTCPCARPRCANASGRWGRWPRGGHCGNGGMPHRARVAARSSALGRPYCGRASSW